jgi:serralysin
MATTKWVPGTGYSSAFINGLLADGPVWNPASGPIKVHFAGANSQGPLHTFEADFSADYGLDWTGGELTVFREILSYVSSICGVTFVEASINDADIVWWKSVGVKLNGSAVPIYQEPPRVQEADKSTQAWGVFDAATEGWNELAAGGHGRFLILRALGRALGLQHVYDDNEFPLHGGTYTWAQGINTVMSTGEFGDPWGFDTGVQDSITYSKAFSAQAGFGAFDIAALQAIYGAGSGARPGNDVYALPMANGPGTNWMTLVDSGGIDTISGQGSPLKVSIDLREASLNPAEKYAGGAYSARIDISGGFTIAKGTVIENAIGGNTGDDLFGNHVGNTLWGGGGHDKLYGFEGNDVLYGGDGDDSLYGGLGNDIVDAGTTSRGGTEGDEFAHGNEGNDTVLGGAGGHSLFGEAGDDTIIDTAGNNDLNGHEGNDFIKGGTGRDRAWGGTGSDRVYGGSDNDYLYGGDGNDLVYGEHNVDSLYGDAGNDKLYGGSGADFLNGGSGDDILYGGAHIDQYTGGAGKDVFVLDSRPSRSALPDKFLDFDPRYDTIRLDKTYYKISKNLLSKNKLKADAFTFGSRAQDREDRIIVDKKAKKVYFDKDGTGGSAQILIAELDKKALKGLSYRDFDIG